MATSNFQEVEQDKVVHIALVGEAETGKSSFVHALKRLKRDKDKAETSVPSASKSEPKCYPYPDKENVKLWDLPSLGTGAYPTSKIYCERLELFDKYNAFLIFTKTRLTSETLRLATRLEAKNKRFFFIRTHIDEVVRNEKETRQDAFNEDTTLNAIREDLEEKLKDFKSISGQQIFLISNVQPENPKWDFLHLSEGILHELPDELSLCFPSINLRLAKLSVTKRLENLKTKENSGTKHTTFSKKHMDAGKLVQDKGIKAAQMIIEKELDQLKNVEMNLAVVGISGTGKSSFINAIRDVNEIDNPGVAAETGVFKETTMKSTSYSYPDNPNITLCDQPGIGTDTFPNLATYCKKVKIEEYDAFIIMSETRFLAEDSQLAKELHSMKKPFFFVRTKIDLVYEGEEKTKGSKFNEVTTLNDCRAYCSEKLKEIDKDFNDNDIFFISNDFRHKWDFPRLTEAILTRLPRCKQEAFCLSMVVLSDKILKRKLKTLRGRIKYTSVFRAKLFKPLKARRGNKWESYENDFGIIVEKVASYRTKLGFPKENSNEFEMMSDQLKKSVLRFYLTNDIDVNSWMEKLKNNTPKYGKGVDDARSDSDDASCTSKDLENFKMGMLSEKVQKVYEMDCGGNIRINVDDRDVKKSDGSGLNGGDGDEEFPPWLNVDEAQKAYYNFVSDSLHLVLDEMGKVASDILKEAAARGEPEMEGIE